MENENKDFLLHPTYNPPAPSKFRNLSTHARFEILAELKSRKIDESLVYSKHDHCNDSSTKSVKPYIVDSASFSLFGGDIVVNKDNVTISNTEKSKNDSSNSSKTTTSSGSKDSSNISAYISSLKTNNVGKRKMPQPSKVGKAPKLTGSTDSNDISPTTKSFTSSSSKVIEIKVSEKTTSSKNAFDVLRQKGKHVYVANDFIGIESFCLNSTSSSESLDAFALHCKSSQVIALSILWRDSTSHAVTSAKLCTPSKPCMMWNCNCDRGKRILLAHENIVGFVFSLKSSKCSISSQSSTGNNTISSLMSMEIEQQPTYDTYFFSMQNTTSMDHSSVKDSLMQKFKNIDLPIDCECTLSQRMDILLSILKSDSIKVVYSSQVVLLCIHSLMHKYMHCGGVDTSPHDPSYKNIFDPKIAMYLCDTTLADEQLECSSLIARCYQMMPSHVSSTENGSMHQNYNLNMTTKLPPNCDDFGLFTKCIHNVACDQYELLHLQLFMVDMLQQKDLVDVFQYIEMPLISQLALMELRGIHLSTSQIEIFAENLRAKIQSLNDNASAIVGHAFNMGSPDQVAHVLYDELKLKVPSSSNKPVESEGKKHLSTAEDTLSKLTGQHPIVSIILDFRYRIVSYRITLCDSV